MENQQLQSQGKPRLLFVDDEQRVLNSMRIMFRRQFDLFFASHGSEALDIIENQDIDVIVADHRMPQMTGVEVLTKVRSLSPRTVRILLTGYADLDAVEGSINECEVFRFLTKPCPPNELRETLSLAAKLARETPVQDITSLDESSNLDDKSVLEIIMESDRVEEVGTGTMEAEPTTPQQTDTGQAVTSNPVSPQARTRQPAFAPPAAPEPKRITSDVTSTDVILHPPQVELAPPNPAPARPAAAKPSAPPRLAAGLGIVVFSNDDEVIATVQKAVRGRLPIHTASNIVQVVKILTDHRPGVLLTDISDDKGTIQAMTARLKEHLPELVTIAVSQHRDVLDMVWLINHGQIFRFLRKPLSSGRCAISLQAALKHHRMLLKNPSLVKRHEVTESEDTGIVDGMLNKIKNMRRLWASA